MVGGGVEDECEAAGADGAEAPQQLEDDAQPRQDEAVQVAGPDVLVERRQACKERTNRIRDHSQRTSALKGEGVGPKADI